MIKFIEIQNGKVVPTEHCYILKFLRDIMEHYAENKQYLKVYGYLFYMTCMNEELNPTFHMSADDKLTFLAKELEIDFSLEDPLVIQGIEESIKLFDTETSRAYRGFKTMLDNLSTYMETTKVSAGRDGNINSLISAAKNFAPIRESFKRTHADLEAEQKKKGRGGQNLAYDAK